MFEVYSMKMQCGLMKDIRPSKSWANINYKIFDSNILQENKSRKMAKWFPACL